MPKIVLIIHKSGGWLLLNYEGEAPEWAKAYYEDTGSVQQIIEFDDNNPSPFDFSGNVEDQIIEYIRSLNAPAHRP